MKEASLVFFFFFVSGALKSVIYLWRFQIEIGIVDASNYSLCITCIKYGQSELNMKLAKLTWAF